MKYELGKLYQGVSYEDYDAQFGIRSSWLKHLIWGPEHFQWHLKNKQDKNAFKIGKIVHGYLEKGESYKNNYLIEPVFEGLTKDGKLSTASKEAREKKKEWYASLSPDQVVVTQKQQDDIYGMINSFSQQKRLWELLAGGEKEVSGWVKDPETGLILKFRADFKAPEEDLWDFKTARSISEASLKSMIFGSNYENSPFYLIQAGHYCYCMKLLGKPWERFTFVFVRNNEGYPVVGVTLDKEQIIKAIGLVKDLLRDYKEYEANEWKPKGFKLKSLQEPSYFGSGLYEGVPYE